MAISCNRERIRERWLLMLILHVDSILLESWGGGVAGRWDGSVQVWVWVWVWVQVQVLVMGKPKYVCGVCFWSGECNISVT